MGSRARWFLLNSITHGAGTTELHHRLNRFAPTEFLQPRYRTREIVVEAEPERLCPEGFEKSGDACIHVETAPAQRKCLPGWQESANDKCVGYTTAKPDRTCTKGHPEYNSCVIKNSVPKQLVCNNGFVLDMALGLCVREVGVPLLKACPPGSQWITDGCRTSEVKPMSITCPSGYLFNGNSCDRVTKAPMDLICAPGFILHSAKQACIKPIVDLMTRECPSPAILRGGRCVTEDRVPVNVSCPVDKELVGNLCIHYERAQPRIRCPAGLILSQVNHMCEGDITQDPIPECTKGTYFNPMTGECGNAFKVKQPNLACPPDFHFVDKRLCAKHVVQQGTKECSPGFDLENKGSCVARRSMPAVLSCPSGSIEAGSFCVTRTVLSEITSCPEGLLASPGGVCEGMVKVAPKQTCPVGYFGNRTDKEPMCLKKESVKPTQRCPDGTTESQGHDELICVDTKPIPHLKYCAPGLRKSDEECIETITEQADEKCPPGYHEDLEEGRCFSSSILPSHNICPAGFKMVGSKCLKQHVREKEIVCPPAFKRTSELECAKHVTVALINQCPFGFEYNAIKGSCAATKVKYEFDGHAAKPMDEETTTEPDEELKDLEVPQEQPHEVPTSAPAETTTEAHIEIQVNRPVVQKGMVVRNEIITLSGPASEVAKKQQILNAGGTDLGDNTKIEYVP